MEILPYDLIPNPNEPNQYYDAVAAFTDEVLVQFELRLNWLVDDYLHYIGLINPATQRTSPEYLIEVLTFGTLWRTYISSALTANPPVSRLMSALTYLRSHIPALKPQIDLLRSLFLPSLSPNQMHSSVEPQRPQLRQFQTLLCWLKATGEFNQEIIRLQPWYRFFQSQSSETFIKSFHQIMQFTAWFATESEIHLGKYTRNVQSFLTHRYPEYRFREDFIFCGRQRVEYHLNMVGAEIMTRAYRSDFLSKQRQVLILPACMRRSLGEKCQAVKKRLGWQCTHCSPGCQVNELTRLGQDNQFEVYVIPHESSLFAKNAGNSETSASIGVVGVACVLNLLAGGWKVNAMNIPPQCVLLNFCGCKAHWDPTGVSTTLNTDQLLKVLGKTSRN